MRDANFICFTGGVAEAEIGGGEEEEDAEMAESGHYKIRFCVHY